MSKEKEYNVGDIVYVFTTWGLKKGVIVRKTEVDPSEGLYLECKKISLKTYFEYQISTKTVGWDEYHKLPEIFWTDSIFDSVEEAINKIKTDFNE